jgi:hypothetical protein
MIVERIERTTAEHIKSPTMSHPVEQGELDEYRWVGLVRVSEVRSRPRDAANRETNKTEGNTPRAQRQCEGEIDILNTSPQLCT